VSFEGPDGGQTHTEVGPPLLEVLAVAGVAPTLNTWVTAVGDDNYVATVIPAGRGAFQGPGGSGGGAPSSPVDSRRCHVRGHSVETELVALDVLHHEARLVVAIGRQ